MIAAEHRLAQELLAVADALRNAAIEILHLERSNHPAVSGQADTAAVRAHSRDVAEALEGLATRLCSRM